MSEYSNFRGLAGEVVVSFVKPGSVVSAVPVLVFFGVGLGATAYLAPEDFFPYDLIIVLVLAAFAISRFAIPSRLGHYEEGWFSQYNSNAESLTFSFRYLVCNICWVMPCFLVLFAAEKLGVDLFLLNTDPMEMAGSGFVGVVGLFIALMVIFAPTLSLLICTASNSIPEILGIGVWKTLISDHKADLVVFYAALIGGVITFWILYFFPLFLIVITAFALSPALGGALAGFVFALPFLLAPILLGRLSGAFVHGLYETDNGGTEGEEGDPPAIEADSLSSPILLATIDDEPSEQPSSEVPPASVQILPVAVDIQGSQLSEKAAIRNLIAKVEGVESLKLDNMILLARNKVLSRPTDPYPAAELSLLLGKKEDGEEMIRSLAVSIPLAINEGVPKLAMRLVMSAVKAKLRPDLDEATWETLCGFFEAAGRFHTAVYCLQSAGNMTAEKIEVLAGSAKERGNSKELGWLNQVLVKKFPDSPQAEHARGCL